MTRGQSMPEQWIIVDGRVDTTVRTILRRLPQGIGVLLLKPISVAELRYLRHVAKLRRLTVVSEPSGAAARVHTQRELTRALLRRTPLLLISPLHETRSHPDWQPMPRMRAATLARLAKRNALALGGMNEKRYARFARLGFSGWAGISAFRT
jgi:thiamine-phosphate pyrophosphorylase